MIDSLSVNLCLLNRVRKKVLSIFAVSDWKKAKVCLKGLEHKFEVKQIMYKQLKTGVILSYLDYVNFISYEMIALCRLSYL